MNGGPAFAQFWLYDWQDGNFKKLREQLDKQ